MTIRSIGMAKLTAILLVVLIAAVACSKGGSEAQPTATESISTGAPVTTPTATTVPAGNNGSEQPAVTATETAEAALEEATGALFLEMTSPADDEVYVSQNSYEISGRTTVDALLSVNDSVLEVDEEGRFSMALDLEEGPNVVEVVASNSLGEQYDRVLLVMYEPA